MPMAAPPLTNSRVIHKAKLLVSPVCRLLSDDNGAVFWYDEPKTTEIPDGERVITDDDFYIVNHPYASKFLPLSATEKTALDLMRQGKVCYSDNLTGADFDNCIKRVL